MIRYLLARTIRSYFIVLLVVVTWFVVGSHAAKCSHKTTHAYLAGATTAEYPGKPKSWPTQFLACL